MRTNDDYSLDLTSDSRLLGALQDIVDELLDMGAVRLSGGHLPHAMLDAQVALAANGGDAVHEPEAVPVSACGDDAMISALEGIIRYAESLGVDRQARMRHWLSKAKTLLPAVVPEYFPWDGAPLPVTSPSNQLSAG